jgi:hypothetical protein
VRESRALLELLRKKLGTPDEHPGSYISLSPLNGGSPGPGNEQSLKKAALRCYYDADISWQLRLRRNGYYDTYLPDGTELINRLLLEGNERAEFVASRLPGVRSNGNRNASSMSIVDETDLIQWIKKQLHVFDPADPMSFSAPYSFGIPENWRAERNLLPPPFAPAFKLKGFEEIRFPPTWGEAGGEAYWSVAYLFWLDAGQKIDETVLQESFQLYFDGLVMIGGGTVSHNIPLGKRVPTRVHIKRTTPEPDDAETYTGEVNMLDYMAMKPITLRLTAHLKRCDAKAQFPLFLELSPQPFENEVWHDLKRMKRNFRCE